MKRVPNIPLFVSCAVLLVGLVFAIGASAQSRITLSGTVLDADSRETLPFASVRIDSLGLGAATNVDGHFALASVPRGRHTLTVSYIGYAARRMTVETDSVSGRMTIGLLPATEVLEEVLVTAEQYSMMKAAESVSQITVSPRDLSVLPSLGEVDIFRSLQLLPGISGTNEGSSGLYVRGGTPDQNLILFDGMTVYHVDHFFGFFSAFNADAIKDVQVFKGAYPAQYGGRSSSVVDLTGKAGADDFRLGVGVNLLSTNVLAEVPLGERASLLLSGRRSYTDIIKSGLYSSIFESLGGGEASGGQPAGGGRPGGFGGGRGGGGALGSGFAGPGQAFVQPDFYFYDTNAKLTLRPSPNDVVALSLYAGNDNLDQSRFTTREITQGGQVGATVTNDVYDVTSWGNTGLSGKWSRVWTPRLYTQLLLSHSRYSSLGERASVNERVSAEADTVTFSVANATFEDNSVSDLSVNFDLGWQASAYHKLAFGVFGSRTETDYDFTRNDSVSVLDRSQNARQLAVYLQDTWKLADRLTIVGGLRAVNYDLTSQSFLEPRASVRFDLTDRIQLKAAYGRYNQFVARVVNENITEGARDFWLLADGQDVGVQSSTHYVAGIAYETPGWLLDIEAYRKKLTGLSEFTLRFSRGTVDIEADNLFFDGDGLARGIEVLLQKKSGRHTGWLSYTLAQVEHTFDGLNDGNPFPALHDQTHEVKLVNALALSRRWSASATWTFATGKPYTAPISEYDLTLLDGSEFSYIHVGEKNALRLPAYHRLDVGVHYRRPVGSSEIDVGFSVFNLYNRTNVWYREFDLAESPFVTTDVTLLGLTPNLSLRLDF